MTTTNQFEKYESISNTYRKKEVKAILDSGCGDEDVEWGVLEKCHGANFSFCCTSGGVRCCKRSGFLEGKEFKSFYNAQEVFDKYQAAAQTLFNAVGNPSAVVYIFGELFGGGYGKMDMPTETTKRVQKGVHYCPHNDFLAFDIRVDDKYLNYDTCIDLFKRSGFLFADVLFRGTFEEVVEWSSQHNEDVTSIPELFGLEPIKGNIREGNVIKPIDYRVLGDGKRVILKDKNEKFNEVSNSGAGASALGDVKKFEKAPNYVTEQRLNNVMSKGAPELISKNIKVLSNLLTADAVDDFVIDHDDAELTQAVRQLVAMSEFEQKKFVKNSDATVYKDAMSLISSIRHASFKLIRTLV